MAKNEVDGVSRREDILKKILLWTVVAAGIGALALLLVYAPDGQDKYNDALSQTMGETKSETRRAPPSVKDLKEIEVFEEEGRTHVDEGTQVTYKTEPPTSGPHYARWMPPGTYKIDETKPELLVHNLEHGNVVIYFDRDQLPKADLDLLLALPKTYSGQWDGVVLVEQKGARLMLTAWQAKLPLSAYDVKKVNQFLDAFRGRGPENRVR
jgi:hypothetical protein